MVRLHSVQNICTNCGSEFEISDKDLAFYDKVSPIFGGKKFAIPPPTHCPACRQQRRVAQGNQIHLYKRKCDLTGEEIVSNYHPDEPYIVYKQEHWWSDKWDPMEFGQDFDFDRSFFDQYNDLLLAVPRHNINTTYEYDENADYTNYATNNKDCYLIFDSDYNRDCYYSYSLNHCEDVLDCFRIRKGQLCYGCIDCVECYSCKFIQDCDNCSDSFFLKNCIGCKHCIMCSNLRDKEYWIENKQVAKEEYEKRAAELSTTSSFKQAQERFEQLKLEHPQKYMHGVQNENVVGDYVTNSKDCDQCFDSSDMWDCKYCYQIWEPVKDSMDIQEIGDGELCYDSTYAGLRTRNLLWCSHCFNNTDLLYSTYCMHCSNLFGCVGLRRKEYCIFNKQFSKEEYEVLVPKVIEHMQKSGEWGEFFPISIACFPYNTSQAQDYFPLTKEKATKKGYKWRDIEDDIPNVTKTIPAEKLPETIADVPDDVLNWAIVCEATKRPFKIIRQELDRYRKMNLPIPHLHPDERHRRRMALRNPRVLHDRECDKCSKEVATTYAPDRKEQVYCGDCYLESLN